MNQQEVSRETVARLLAERENTTDPDAIAGLDYHIRLHSDLAGLQDALFAGIPEAVKKLADDFLPELEGLAGELKSAKATEAQE